ncbi:MAG: hypothetical protein HEEMFOPI_00473 [Holosporales bacterium]
MTKIRLRATFLVALVLCSCTGGKQNSRLDQREERDFSFGALHENGFSIFQSDTSNKKDALWQASLSALKSYPIQTSDYKGGLISTDWHTEKSLNKRKKITVQIKDDRDLFISVFVQTLKSGQWIDSGTDDLLQNKIKDQILKIKE